MGLATAFIWSWFSLTCDHVSSTMGLYSAVSMRSCDVAMRVSDAKVVLSQSRPVSSFTPSDRIAPRYLPPYTHTPTPLHRT